MRPFFLRSFATLILWLSLAGLSFAGPGSIVNSRDVVGFLASPELEGRLTGTPGEQKAGAFISEKFKALGLQYLPGKSSYSLPFEFTAGIEDIGSRIELTKSGTPEHSWSDSAHIQTLSLSKNGSATGSVVFAGYGLRTTQDAGFTYDSFSGLDLKGKIVILFRYYPENVDQAQQLALTGRASELRTKVQSVRDLGASAVLITFGPTYSERSVIPLTYDNAPADSDLIAATISTDVAESIFAAGGKSPDELKTIQQRLDAGDPAVHGFDLPGVKLTITTKLKVSKQIAHNIVGYLPATAVDPISDEYIGIGAHYDHLGTGAHVGNSLARKNETGKLHLGADDNASGVAGVLLAAERLSKEKLKRPVFVALWSGEEIGTIGSREFVKHGPIPPAKVAAYVNLDMVGRVRDNKLNVLGVGSSHQLALITTTSNERVHFKISQVQDPYNPTDSSSFYLQGVPVLNLFSGSHEDYHRPSDSADKINYPDLDRVGEFAYWLVNNIDGLPKRPDYQKLQGQSGGIQTGARSGLRVSTGSIPDYASDAKGLKLSGVVAGGPADKAGLKEGDVVIAIGGRKIANIYDYTNIFESLKPGQRIKYTYIRGDKQYDTELTPEARAKAH